MQLKKATKPKRTFQVKNSLNYLTKGGIVMKEFIDAVKEMRLSQKHYFVTRSKEELKNGENTIKKKQAPEVVER